MTFIILYSRAEGILEVSLQLLETYIDEKQTPKPLMIYSKYLNSCKCMKFWSAIHLIMVYETNKNLQNNSSMNQNIFLLLQNI